MLRLINKISGRVCIGMVATGTSKKVHMAEWAKELQHFPRNEHGATATEYALIAVLCSVAIIAGWAGTRDGINTHLSDAATGLKTDAN